MRQKRRNPSISAESRHKRRGIDFLGGKAAAAVRSAAEAKSEGNAGSFPPEQENPDWLKQSFEA